MIRPAASTGLFPSALPSSLAEVVKLVQEAAASGTSLAVIGSGSKRTHGPAVRPEARVVSLRHLSHLVAHEPGDLVVTVQAGMRLDDLQRKLAQHGQWLPVDPPYAGATIGGILASASSGPRRLGYGGIKDQVLGLRVVGPGGVATKSGGRVVKNVTGYDLHKLHVGAWGTLGVLVEAHLKVRPRPELSGVVVCGCADLAAAHRFLLEVWTSSLRPVALEALSAGASAALRGLIPGLLAGDALSGDLAVIGIDGTRPVFERHLRELESRRATTRSLAVLRGPAADRLWAALRDLPDRQRHEVAVRLGARPHDLPALLQRVGPAAVTLQVHAGLGLARATLPRSSAPEIAALVGGWHGLAAAQGGYAVVEAAPLDLEGRAELPWGKPRTDLGERLHRQWDPGAVLNPGRMAL